MLRYFGGKGPAYVPGSLCMQSAEYQSTVVSSSNARYVRIHTYPGIEQKQYVRQQELGV